MSGQHCLLKPIGLAPAVLMAMLVLAIPGAAAHHSAALFYDLGAKVTITGVVTRFNFRNPHAIVELQVMSADGELQRWTAETSAPSALRRRGWKQESLTAGEVVTLDGVPARDGSHFMRITRAVKADGSEIGVPRGTDN